MEKIDIVILWVDGSNPEWLKKISQYKKITLHDEIRYRDYGTLKYLFRSIDKYCPWVNKIHLITDEQVPKWLKTAHDKINLVFHKDFIPAEYLPTFNSNVIELNLFRLEDLSDKFILFNDDMFLNNEVKKEEFFIDDKICDFGIYNRIAPVEQFSHILLNNMIIINKHFNRKESRKSNWKKQFSIRYSYKMLGNILTLPWKEIPGYYNHHFPQAHIKSTFSELYQLEKKEFERTFNNKFRESTDINHWLCRYWMLEEGKFIPQYRKFGKYIPISDMTSVSNELLKGKTKVICINDVEGTNSEVEEWMENLKSTFKLKFPNKSQFEK